MKNARGQDDGMEKMIRAALGVKKDAKRPPSPDVRRAVERAVPPKPPPKQ